MSKGSGELNSIRQWFGRRDNRPGNCKLLFDHNNKLVVGDDEVVLEEVGDDVGHNASRFNVARYFSLLQVKGLKAAGRRLLYAPSVSSTQEILKGPLFDGWDCWRLAFVADQQTQGKGRGENQWVSPAGCLMCSFQVVQTDGVKLPMLQYLVSLSLLEGIRRLPGGDSIVGTHLKIKWPNDLYCSNAKHDSMVKVGGILCQSSYWQQQFVVTIGFGLNVSNAHPTRCTNDLFREAGHPEPSREAILASFFNVLEDHLEEFDRSGFEPFRAAYEGMWMHTMQLLRLEDGSNVQVEAITSNGLLRARDIQTGVLHDLQPDGNSLDWFKGLLKRKVILQ